jgi:hypothetical protein
MSVRDYLYHPVSGKTNNLLLFFVALVPAFLLFPFPASVFANGIDPPLAWVFNFLIKGNLHLGKQIIFPHGPLAFLMYPLPMGSNLWIAVSVHLIARIFMAYSLLKLATRKPLSSMGIAIVSAFILLSINDLLLTVVQIIILCYLNFFERRNVWWLIPALIITPLALYVKAFVGIVSLMVTLAFAGIMIYRMIIGIESWYRLLLILIVPFILLAGWMAMYGDLLGLSGYLKGMADLAADNSAAVAVYPDNNWWITGIAISGGLLLIIFNLKNIVLARFTILAGPALFAIWKYGMARQDYLHTSMMFVFILFIVLVYNILTGKINILNSVISVIVIALFYITLQQSFYFEPFHIKANGAKTLSASAFNYRYFADTCTKSSDSATERNKLDNSIIKMIGTKTADIYPWDYTYIAANNLNWQPRHVLQSYASYTRDLDRLNSSHFASEKAPEFLIWELQKITHDIHGGTLESIDGRYLLNDEPEALMVLLCNYELAARQGGIFPAMIYQKRKDVLVSTSNVIHETKANWNEWIDVPMNSSGILKASVDMQRNLSGKLKSFFYKDEAVYVYYLLENGDIRMYRIVPKNASYGLWVNPLIINPEKGRIEPAVRKIMFRCSNTDMMKDEIDIRWNHVTFRKRNDIPGMSTDIIHPVYSFFGISSDSASAELLLSENNLEKPGSYWSIPDEAKISAAGKNRALNLMPGDYSVSFEYPFDSLTDMNNSVELVVRTGVWAKAGSGARAVYVISVEKEGKSLLWKAVDINSFIHDKRTMNFVTNYALIDKKMLQQSGLILKVYAWNTGNKPIELDDFSIRIETR